MATDVPHLSVVSSHHDRAGEHWTKTIRYRLIHLLIRHIGQVGRDRDDAACGNDITKAIQPDGRVRIRNRHRRKRVGYGKLSSWDRIAERADATLIAASGSHVRASDGAVRVDDEHSRRLPVRHAHHSIDLDRRAQFGGQRVFALHAVPAASTEGTGVFDQHHHAGADDREALRVIQGYGMLSAGQYEFLPCFLHVLEDAQIGLQIISGSGLDVGVSELPCDHADVGSGLDRQRAERVA